MRATPGRRFFDQRQSRPSDMAIHELLDIIPPPAEPLRKAIWRDGSDPVFGVHYKMRGAKAMAGTLYHGRDFVKEEFVGNDGCTHYEVTPVQGGTDVVSVSNWVEIQDYCESKGFARSAWSEYDHAFDVPLAEVRDQNAELLRLVAALPAESASRFHWLERVVAYLKRGEVVFFSRA